MQRESNTERLLWALFGLIWAPLHTLRVAMQRLRGLS